MSNSMKVNRKLIWLHFFHFHFRFIYHFLSKHMPVSSQNFISISNIIRVSWISPSSGTKITCILPYWAPTLKFWPWWPQLIEKLWCEAGFTSAEIKNLHFPSNAAATCQSKLLKQVILLANVSMKWQIVYKSRKISLLQGQPQVSLPHPPTRQSTSPLQPVWSYECIKNHVVKNNNKKEQSL